MVIERITKKKRFSQKLFYIFNYYLRTNKSFISLSSYIYIIYITCILFATTYKAYIQMILVDFYD